MQQATTATTTFIALCSEEEGGNRFRKMHSKCLPFPTLLTVERQVDHRNIKWLTLYLCCLLTEMADILFPATVFQDVLTFKISAPHYLYFQSIIE